MDPAFPLVWRLQADIAGSGTHGDIDAHIIDLSRYLVGDLREVCGTMETFIKERPLQGEAGAGLAAQAGQDKGKVTVDDAVSWIGRFENGALANLEATRFAAGRKNHIIGYEHTFVHTFADFVRAVVAGQSVQPTFADGLANERVLSAISESARTRRWVTL